MARVQEGDFEAFDELCRRHRDNVVYTISKMMGSSSLSEDLAQQVFLQAFCGRKNYAPTAKFSTWLYAITRNVVWSAKRVYANRRMILDRSCREIQFSGREPASTEPGPSASTVQSETQAVIHNAINRLGRRQRVAIQLVYLEGYCYRTAGERMGLTENSVRQLLHRGRAKLRVILEAEAP